MGTAQCWKEDEYKRAAAIFAELSGKKAWGRIFCLIAQEIHRSVSAIQTRHHRYGPTFNNLKPQYEWRIRRQRLGFAPRSRDNRRPSGSDHFHHVSTKNQQPPDDLIEERNRAFEAGHPSTTSLLLGDPLPGRSALDHLKHERGVVLPPDAPLGAVAVHVPRGDGSELLEESP